MPKKKELINNGDYFIGDGRGFNEQTIQYKSIDRVYTFQGRFICNLLMNPKTNLFQVVLVTGTEIMVSKQFYDEIEKRMS